MGRLGQRPLAPASGPSAGRRARRRTGPLTAAPQPAPGRQTKNTPPAGFYIEERRPLDQGAPLAVRGVEEKAVIIRIQDGRGIGHPVLHLVDQGDQGL